VGEGKALSASQPGPSADRRSFHEGHMRSTKQPCQVNLDKFKDVQSDILDAAAHTWVLALQNVKTEPSNILDHPESELLRGYALPDPFLFLNSFNNDKEDKV